MLDGEGLSLTALLFAGAAMALAGLVHGTLGLGFPMVATPLLALVVDVRTAIVLTLLPTASVNIATVLRGGRWSESIGRFWPLAVYGVVGTVIGTRLLIVSDPAPFKLLLAGLILLYLLTSRSDALRLGWVVRHPRASMLVFGLLAGLAAGTTNVMVPLLIIYTLELGLTRTTMVQVFNMCFLAGKVSQIAVFAAAGALGSGFVATTVPLAAVAVVFLLAGAAIRDRIPTETYRVIVRRVLLVLAFVLIGQYVLVS